MWHAWQETLHHRQMEGFQTVGRRQTFKAESPDNRFTGGPRLARICEQYCRMIIWCRLCARRRIEKLSTEKDVRSESRMLDDGKKRQMHKTSTGIEAE